MRTYLGYEIYPNGDGTVELRHTNVRLRDYDSEDAAVDAIDAANQRFERERVEQQERNAR